MADMDDRTIERMKAQIDELGITGLDVAGLRSARGRARDAALRQFADTVRSISDLMQFKMSSRGWCYILEGLLLITKGEFDNVQGWINDCRKNGLLPIRMVAEDAARVFQDVEDLEAHATFDAKNHIAAWMNAALNCSRYVEVNYWAAQDYYIQLMVEKVDLVTLFKPVCQKYHVPIANCRGWSSILQRADLVERFKTAEEMGKTCVLLYVGDLDPDGLRISETMMKNLEDIAQATGYDPSNLIIDRVGLNYDFVKKAKLTMIDGLETGSGRRLDSPEHPNHYKDYVQEYLRTIGPRKCEANALVIRPEMGRNLCEQAIQKYLGEDPFSAAEAELRKRKAEVESLLESVEASEHIGRIVTDIEGDE